MSAQHIVNESDQKTEVNLEHDNERVARRETITSVSESYPATPRDPHKSKGVNSLVLLATKEDIREIREDPTSMPLVLMYKGEILVSNDMNHLPFGVCSVLQDFGDVFLDKVPTGLPPLRGIEHQIYFILGATLPNRARYRTNPEETKEI
jgi:hypothetical protein